MKLTLENGELALPDNFTFNIESNHPFFSDEGTASIPVTLPASPENLSLLGHPDRINNAHRHIREYQACLQTGIFQKRCRLISESAGKEAGISASLALEESEMYAEIQDRNLRDIFAAQSYIVTRSTIYTPFQVYKGAYRDFDFLKDLAFFPVATDKDGSGNVSIINEPLEDKFNEDARIVTVNGKTFSVPAGYGVAPYMFLWSMIDRMFTLAGYEVEYNAFSEVPLKEIVVVHNCADLYCAIGNMSGSQRWEFNYSDLVPNVTVGDFIVFLRDTFGAFISCKNRKISINLIRYVINEKPDMDISQYVRSERSIMYPEQISIERSMDTSLESAEPAAETLIKLRAAHESLAEASSESQIAGTGLFFVPPLGKYFFKQDAGASATMIGSDCFMYSRELPMESAEEISSKARFLPMVLVKGRYMPYIGKRIHRYIDVDDKDNDAAQPIQICYAHFWQETDNFGTVIDSHFCGSSYSYYEDGTKAVYMVWNGSSVIPTEFARLTPEGLSRYWADYESLIINGAPDIESIMDIPLETFIMMNHSTPKLLNGAKVIIKSMDYSISDESLTTVKMTLQLLPSYVDKIVPPPIVFDSSYAWAIRSDRSIFPGNGYEILETDGLQDYTSLDAPKEKPTVAGVTTKYRRRWLRYKYTKKWKTWLGWGSSTHTGTHQWNEYFISEAQGS